MKLHIIPLSGVEEVGRNCTIFEYGQDIIVVDLGFDFSGYEFPGADYLLPDTDYLEKNKQRIRGVVLTHGHLDHIGGVPYLIEKLGYPVVFGSKLAISLLQEQLKERRITKAKTQIVDPEKSLNLGVFQIDFFRVVHNIPDSFGLAIKTPLGVVVHTGDFKIDDNPADQKPLQKDKLKSLVKKGALALLSDSTNAALPGRSVPEKQVGEIIDQIIGRAEGRIIFTTFSTLISRVGQVIKACQKYGRKIALVGMSMQKTVDIAHKLGYLNLDEHLGMFVDFKEIGKYADKKILVLVAGAQGIEGSSMVRIAESKHWSVRIKRGDTVVLSSSIVPGNELAVHKMMDGLVNQGARIIYRTVLGSGVHSSGHAFQDELKEMLRLVRPKFFIPIEGQHYMQAAHIDLAKEMGLRGQNCFMLYNGQILEIDERRQARVLKKRVSHSVVLVEGNKVGILNEEIFKIRDRMSESGVCVVFLPFPPASKKQGREVSVIVRGLTLNGQMIQEIKNKTKKLAKKFGMKKNAKIKIESSLGDFILNKTGKKPFVIVVT